MYKSIYMLKCYITMILFILLLSWYLFLFVSLHVIIVFISYMGKIKIQKPEIIGGKSNVKSASANKDADKRFVLSDVTKDELEKRRVPVYTYLL